jgi:type VI secretion system protein ImpA
MASPEVLDFGTLLAALPGDNPAGVDLRSDPSPASPYYAIKDARSAARAAERQMVLGDDAASGDGPDWRPVLENATRALAERTKDLEIAAYLIEALVRQHGFAGLRDGFRLTRELVERYWDVLYPLPDEDGLATRVAPLAGLNGVEAEGTLIVPIAMVPLTEAKGGAGLSQVHYQQAQALGKITDPKRRERTIAQGAIPLEAFQQAVAESSPRFFGNLVGDLAQCQEEFARLCAALDERCGGEAPPTSNIKAALGSFLDVVRDVARNKLEAAPAKGGAGAGDAAPGSPAASAPGHAVDAIQTREDAFAVLLKVADYFRRTEPHTVVSFTLEQVVRWGQMSLPELLTELIPDEAPRKSLFKHVGIRPPEPAKEAKK